MPVSTRRPPLLQRVFLVLALLTAATPAAAHSFGRMYNLPVPFWLYAYGATATLLLSFVLVAWFAQAAAPGSAATGRALDEAPWRLALRRARLIPVLRTLSLGALLLCLATGFWGNPNPYANFSMTFFWIVFVLGYAYATALFGNLYAVISPWRVLADALGRLWPRAVRGFWPYPERLGYTPALLLYIAFIGVELFAQTRPPSLAALLLGYSLLTLAGVVAFGREAWLRQGEFFAVFLGLLARMSPFDYRPELPPGAPGRLRWRRPFAGLQDAPAERMSLVLFLLFMLSSTAFDGLHVTVGWVNLFWRDLYGLVAPLLGERPINLYAALRPWYLGWQLFWLVASAFLYLALYLLFIAMSRHLAGSHRPLRELALRFAPSLLPIALVYHLTHYYSLLLTQGVKILNLVSDPFGWGWNLFGTAGWLRAPLLPDMAWVWHSQVGLILAGHIVSVALAHREALLVFPTRRQALLSQLPMLLLMVLFTTFGLWILAQPIQGGG